MVKNFLRVLVCPLDWGIGHATRCVPVIRHLQEQDFEVLIAADGRPLEFLKDYFPGIEFIRFPGIRISYPSGNKMMLKMMFQSPGILYNIYKEHNRLKKIIKEHQIDVVISDNRFGLWSDKAYSVYMTHQMMIKAPAGMKWAEPLLFRMHNRFIKHYDECWVPDVPGVQNLSGDLGHNYPLPENGHFAGILSRFEKPGEPGRPDDPETGPDLLVMLSGPEPQRTILEEMILWQLKDQKELKTVILRGLPGSFESSSPLPGLSVHNHLPDADIARLISHAGVIICRPGYSSLMDLVTLNRTAVLVPTPGQTEQEYLAGYLSAGGSFFSMEQEGFELGRAIEAGRQLPRHVDFPNDGSLLDARIQGLEKVKPLRH